MTTKILKLLMNLQSDSDDELDEDDIEVDDDLTDEDII
jgi:hypothetical protein